MTDSRPSPLNDVHVEAGASFTDFGGWRMPVRYSSDLAEHHAVRRAAGLFDLSHMGEIAVSGPEAAEALDAVLAGWLSAIAVGQAKYTLLLNESGGIVDDLIVYRTDDDGFLVVANASNRKVVAEQLRASCTGFECIVDDRSDDTALIAVQGPRAAAILRELPGLVAEALDGLRYYRAVAGTFRGEPVLIARTGYTGEDGFELYVPPALAPALWTALIDAGASHGLVPAGLASRDTLRLEAGMSLYGHELGADLLPQQAGLGRVVALSKPSDFIGRAAVERGPAEGARVLVGLSSEGRRAGRAGYAVFAEEGADAAAGVVTSGALSPTLGHPVAMAYVDPAMSEVGGTLFIDVRGTRVAASVVPLPFYQRKA